MPGTAQGCNCEDVKRMAGVGLSNPHLTGLVTTDS